MATYDSVIRTVPLLEVRDLHRSFYGIRALDGVDLVVQPGTIRTELTEREQRFELPAYTPLVTQYHERFARYRKEHGPSAEEVAREIADLVERPKLPLRVPVGLRSERMAARLNPGLLGRLVRRQYKW